MTGNRVENSHWGYQNFVFVQGTMDPRIQRWVYLMIATFALSYPHIFEYSLCHLIENLRDGILIRLVSSHPSILSVGMDKGVKCQRLSRYRSRYFLLFVCSCSTKNLSGSVLIWEFSSRSVNLTFTNRFVPAKIHPR